jgi:hypothetical protein
VHYDRLDPCIEGRSSFQIHQHRSHGRLITTSNGRRPPSGRPSGIRVSLVGRPADFPEPRISGVWMREALLRFGDVPATTSVTLKRGQQILAWDWYACYVAIEDGKRCK